VEGPHYGDDPFPRSLLRFMGFLEIKGRSPATARAYRRQLVNFWVDFLFARDLTLREVTEDDLVDYLRGLPKNGSSRPDAIRALRSYFGFAQGRERDDNPMSHLATPKAKVTPAPRFPRPEFLRLARAAFHVEPRRGWALLLLYATGARIGSFVAIRRQDVYLELDTPYVHFRTTKGDRPYDLPLGHMGQVAARHLLALGNDPIVGVGQERFRQWMAAAEAAAGTRHVWPHLLRHEFATHTIRQTDPETWRQLMNHADLGQLPRYVATDDGRKRDALKGQ
jgi:site-specific recombinase XerD